MNIDANLHNIKPYSDSHRMAEEHDHSMENPPPAENTHDSQD